MNNLIKHLALGITVAGWCLSASAVPTLRLDDGLGNTVTLTQGGVPVITGAAVTFFSSSVVPGFIVWNGSLGANWSVTATAGLSKPASGTVTRPEMVLNSVDSSLGAGTLTIMWTDTGFGPTIGNAFAAIGGDAAGTVTYDTFGNAGNVPFGMGAHLTGPQVFGPGAFSGTATGSNLALLGNPYTLTEVVQITHTAAGISSFNARLTVPDVGMTWMLLGSSLAGLGLFGRSRKRTNRA